MQLFPSFRNPRTHCFVIMPIVEAIDFVTRLFGSIGIVDEIKADVHYLFGGIHNLGLMGNGIHCTLSILKCNYLLTRWLQPKLFELRGAPDSETNKWAPRNFILIHIKMSGKNIIVIFSKLILF